jgi:hypothetical protein
LISKEHNVGQLQANPKINEHAHRLAVLIGGDVLVMLIFIWIGRASHGFSGLDLLGHLETSAPFWIGWFLVTPWFGLFRIDVSQHWRKAIPRLLIAWAIGGPLSLVIRNLFIGRPPVAGIILSFAIVMLTGSTIFMLGWRLAYAAWAHRTQA